MARKRYLPVDLVKASVWVRPELLERCRHAVVFVQRDSAQYSFTRLLDDALTREVRRLEQKHRGGRPFPKGELTVGSRPKPRPTDR